MGDPSGRARGIEVRSDSDILHVQQHTRAFASELGFDRLAVEELGIVVTELATNLIKHAGRGFIRLRHVTSDSRIGLEIESRNFGGGIWKREQALADGSSTTGTMGTGLGAVNRLMDELLLDEAPQAEGGCRVRCIRWIEKVETGVLMCPLQFGTLSRPHPQESTNGDDFVVHVKDDNALVAVIDGLGHGPSANVASRAARQWIERHASQPLASIFSGVGRECVGTNGVVMALARVGWRRGSLEYGSIGNVEGRLFRSGGVEYERLHLQRGILGRAPVEPCLRTYSWGPGCLLVLHTDGVRPTWDWNQLAVGGDPSPMALARRILRRERRDSDDATVVVVKGGSPS